MYHLKFALSGVFTEGGIKGDRLTNGMAEEKNIKKVFLRLNMQNFSFNKVSLCLMFSPKED